jgi:hypothetical protein
MLPCLMSRAWFFWSRWSRKSFRRCKRENRHLQIKISNKIRSENMYYKFTFKSNLKSQSISISFSWQRTIMWKWKCMIRFTWGWTTERKDWVSAVRRFCRRLNVGCFETFRMRQLARWWLVRIDVDRAQIVDCLSQASFFVTGKFTRIETEKDNGI